jgi:hypothetical protein
MEKGPASHFEVWGLFILLGLQRRFAEQYQTLFKATATANLFDWNDGMVELWINGLIFIGIKPNGIYKNGPNSYF